MPKSRATILPSPSTRKLPVEQSVQQKGLDELAPELGDVETQRLQFGDVAERRAFDPFHRQDFARGAVPIDLRRTEIGVLGEILAIFGRGRRLQPEIHLHPHRARQRLDDLHRPQPLGVGNHALGEAGGEEHVGEIVDQPALDPRPQHLNGDDPLLVPVHDPGAMYLRDRGGGDRLAELDEHAVQRGLKRRLDPPDRDLARKRRDAVLQPLQFARHCDADDIGPRGEELAELDIGRSEFLHRPRKPMTTRALAPEQLQGAQSRPRDGRQNLGVDAFEHAFARHDQQRIAEPSDVTYRREQGVRASSRNESRRRRRSAARI